MARKDWRKSEEAKDRQLLTKALRRIGVKPLEATPRQRVEALERQVAEMLELRAEIAENYPTHDGLALARLDVRLEHAVKLLMREKLGMALG